MWSYVVWCDIDPYVHCTTLYVQANVLESPLRPLPPRYGILVESPKTFNVQPMMINTHDPSPNRTHGQPGGPIPARRHPGWGRNPAYSPLIECPCTDRKAKIVTRFHTREAGSCPTGAAAANASACFAAVSDLGLNPVVRTGTVNSHALPAGCSVVSTQDGYEAVFNTDKSSPSMCGPHNASAPVRALGTANAGGAAVGVHVALDLREAGWAGLQVGLQAGLQAAAGEAVTVAGGTARINITGPAGVWFGAGFGASTMKGTYAIIVDGHGVVTERQLGDHAPGIVLSPWNANVTTPSTTHAPSSSLSSSSFTVVSNEVTGGTRTVVVQRPLTGPSSAYYTFDPRALAGLSVLSAVGSSPDFSFHKVRTGALLRSKCLLATRVRLVPKCVAFLFPCEWCVWGPIISLFPFSIWFH